MISIDIPDTNKAVVVIKIKESLEPIMDTPSNRFYIRINDQSLPADYGIVKTLFNKEIYQTEKRIQRIFDIIKQFLGEMVIRSSQRRSEKIAYEICLNEIILNVHFIKFS